MVDYVVSCEISKVTPLQVALLEQAGCRVQEEVVEFELQRLQEETSDEFRERAGRWIRRELSRLNVLTGNLLKYRSLKIDPPPGGVTVTVAAAWGHAPQSPPCHVGWLKEGAEFRVTAWDVASHAEDLILRFVILDSICESAGVLQTWHNKDSWPPRFAEIRLIRNLLVHGSPDAKREVKQYLDSCIGSMPGNRFTNRHSHIELARLRAPHLTAAVWNIVINDCVETEVEIFCDKPAGLKGIIIETQGPHSIYNGQNN